MNRSIVTVEDSQGANFEVKCQALVKRGYKLVCASCGFVNSEQYDFCDSFQAVFALPEALANHLAEVER